jgi:phosphatidylserine decarboxylase
MLFETAIGPLAVIMVGAMLVASISIAWEGIITPPAGHAIKEWDYTQQNKQFTKGAELGHFELGSTVILLLGANAVDWVNALQVGKEVQFGQRLAET